MLKEDLDFIERMVAKHYHGGMVLDVGSGTLEFRRREKFSYDLAPLFDPDAYHTFDLKQGAGVSMVGDAHHLADYFEPRPFSFLICSSLLEHVRKPWVVVAQMWQVLKPGGVIVVSVPWVYPTHDDPVDLWRMSAGCLASLFNPYFQALHGVEMVNVYGGSGSAFQAPAVMGVISLYCGKAREEALGG